jgi:hypothetical protein
MIKKVKIGATDYQVKILPTDKDNQYGACVYSHQIIYLSPNQLHQSASDTLLHEVLHAIWHEAGIEHNEIIVEETVVRNVSTWLRIVFTDNPELVKFIVNSKNLWPYGPTSDPLKDATE